MRVRYVGLVKTPELQALELGVKYLLRLKADNPWFFAVTMAGWSFEGWQAVFQILEARWTRPHPIVFAEVLESFRELAHRYPNTPSLVLVEMMA